MFFKLGLWLIPLLVGSLALPQPKAPETDFSQFFVHADPEARIVGGSLAEEGSVPYMVAIGDGFIVKSFICGGSIITPRTVLTAAHCIDIMFSWTGLSRNIRLTVGTNRHSYGGGTFYGASRNVTHPEYHRMSIKNDIALLITSSAIRYTALVQPVALSFDHVPGGVVARAAGWGRIGFNQALSGSLRELFVSTIEGQQCVRDMAAAAVIHNFLVPDIDPTVELCTIHSPDHGMCNGDSGSALVRVDSGEQVGVVSWGLPCARGAPDVFVRLSAYLNWLKFKLNTMIN